MSYWHLLWMFVTALGIIALGLAVPFVWHWARQYGSTERARHRQLMRRVIREYLRQERLYGRPLRGCLYCGTECTFGPNCANHDLAPDRCKQCRKPVRKEDAFCVAPGDPCWKAWVESGGDVRKRIAAGARLTEHRFKL